MAAASPVVRDGYAVAFTVPDERLVLVVERVLELGILWQRSLRSLVFWLLVWPLVHLVLRAKKDDLTPSGRLRI